LKLERFLLDQWLEKYQSSTPPIQFHLASSTGPPWTTNELLGLIASDEQQELLDKYLLYSRSQGADDLREAIGEMEGVPAESVLVLTGASEALLLLFFIGAEPGDNVIVPFPCFPTMAALPRSLGIETRRYKLRPEQKYRIDLDEIAALVDARTRILLVNSPHNPTGSTLTDEEMDSLYELAQAKGIQFVCDEVYHPIYHGPATPSATRLPKATVLGDLSKALSLSGLRIGWIVERDHERMEAYLNARQYFTITNSPLTESLATIAIRNRSAIWQRTFEVASANLELLDQFFAASASILSWVRPGGGMTAFPSLNSGVNSRSFCEELAARGVLLAPGDCFEMPSHFRLGFGALDQERFASALQQISEYIHLKSAQTVVGR
jgi:aspartate/methionine/tyrosine aminotransferase